MMELLAAEPVAVPEQIARVAEARAKALALSQGSRFVTYEELNRRADDLAAFFGSCGVQPGQTIAICVERSFEGITAALGAMRAGAAYVPLDLTWPDARLRYAIADSGARVLVASRVLAGRIAAEILCVDPVCAPPALPSTARRQGARIDPQSLAYVIYTSGSTGVPKGVEITHANLANLVQWHQEAFDLRKEDRASHVAGLGFDAAVWEVWPNLCSGAAVILPEDEDTRRSPEQLQAWMLREQVTIGFVPTVHAGPMMQMDWPQSTALRILLTGGDSLQQGLVRNLPFAVFNNYGPTECTVVSTSALIRPGEDGPPPIGSGIKGVRLYLLDETGIPVADGVPGEIYIGGNGVGRGYRNLENATARSFVHDPFAGTPGARMFRTADRAVRQANGELRFLGRLDRQVKVRGQRLELDEIAALLSRHPAVAFATASLASADGREGYLVGYILLRRNMEAPTHREMKAFLRESLPEYMVPATVVQLTEIPLLPNGKIDFGKLPVPELPESEGGPTATAKMLAIVRTLLETDELGEDDDFFLAGGDSLLGMQLVMEVQREFGLKIGLQELFETRTAGKLSRLVERRLCEQRLAAIWKEVLGRPGIGVDEDFYRIGGSDQLALIVCDRMTAETGQTMTVTEFRSHPTIRRQADLALGWTQTSRSLPPGVVALRSQGTRDRIFWAHYLSANLARAIGDEWPFLSVTLTAEDIVDLGTSPTLERIGACIVGKIRTTQPAGPYIVGGLCLGGVLAWEIASQLRSQGEEVRLLVVIDPPSPLRATDYSSHRWAYLRYAVKRAEWLGARATFRYSRERLIKTLPRRLWKRFGVEEVHLAQEAMEKAVFRYRPRIYDSRVLLLLASERHPYNGSPAEWEALAPEHLHTEYVEAYHRELMDPQNASRIARTIRSCLETEARGGNDRPEAAGYAIAM